MDQWPSRAAISCLVTREPMEGVPNRFLSKFCCRHLFNRFAHSAGPIWDHRTADGWIDGRMDGDGWMDGRNCPAKWAGNALRTPLGRFLGASGGPLKALGSPWGVLGGSSRVQGCPWGALGRSSGALRWPSEGRGRVFEGPGDASWGARGVLGTPLGFLVCPQGGPWGCSGGPRDVRWRFEK